jgi:hypothetical protein
MEIGMAAPEGLRVIFAHIVGRKRDAAQGHNAWRDCVHAFAEMSHLALVPP